MQGAVPLLIVPGSAAAPTGYQRRVILVFKLRLVRATFA